LAVEAFDSSSFLAAISEFLGSLLSLARIAGALSSLAELLAWLSF
jgi:hypothetical protein